MSKVLGTLVFVALQALAAAADAADAGAKFSDEFAKQDRIYRARGAQAVDGYVTDRSLAGYAAALPAGFERELASLGPADRWLDVGAGEGRAILDYYTPEYDLANLDGWQKRGKKARAVALSIEDRRTPLWEQTATRLEARQLQYFCDKRLRDFSLEELGQFRMISDVFGGFSYADNLTQFVEKALNHLELNGSFYTVLQDVRIESGTNQPYYKNAPFLTEVSDADGKEVSMCAWLKSISCVQVACQVKDGWKPPIETYHIRKVCNEIRVPELTLTHYQSGTPPERRYRRAAAPKDTTKAALPH